MKKKVLTTLLCVSLAATLLAGCGGGEGNQSCKIARCSMEHGRPEYCNECKEYPCETYEGIDAFDSFITHYNQKKDLEKRQGIGVPAYQEEQREKADILRHLLENYNDGRPAAKRECSLCCRAFA